MGLDSAAETAEKIRQAAEEVVKKPPPVSPYSAGKDGTLEVELNDGIYLDTMRRKFKDKMKDDRALVLHCKSATAAWAQYWQMKLHCYDLVAKGIK